MSVSERLRKIRESLGKTQKEMSSITGISYRTWQNYEDGVNNPGWDACQALAGLNIDANWLLTGEGEMRRGESLSPIQMSVARGGVSEDDEDYVQVPRYEVAASAGGGAMVHSEQIVDVMTFKAEWLRVSVGVSPHRVAVISVAGDSMDPLLADGDLILVDLSVTSIRANDVYVLQLGGFLLVKRVQVGLNGDVTVKSDNPTYAPEILRGEAVERLNVVGRMVRRLVR